MNPVITRKAHIHDVPGNEKLFFIIKKIRVKDT
jgi:hypothetical protein